MEEKRARINGWGPGSVTFEGLTEDERNKMEGVVRGHAWVTGEKEGRLKFVDTREKLPSPEDDDEMLPFWRKPQNGERVQVKLENLSEESLKHSSPSIFIQHLCGYNYTPENYRHVARELEAYGFECMRSRRGLDGRFWEGWFLPALFFATGALEKAIKDKKTKGSEIDKAVRFLCEHSSFGTLDVCVQRACMVAD